MINALIIFGIATVVASIIAAVLAFTRPLKIEPK